MQNERVSCYSVAIIVAIPVVDCMSPVFNLQCRVSITCFSKCRIFWLWIQITAPPTMNVNLLQGQILAYTRQWFVYFTLMQDLLDFLHLRLLRKKVLMGLVRDTFYLLLCCSLCWSIDAESKTQNFSTDPRWRI